MESDDSLRLIQAEWAKQQARLGSSTKPSNPFSIPDDVDYLFGGAQLAKKARGIARQELLHSSLIQRTDLLRPRIPSCIIKRHTGTSSLVWHSQNYYRPLDQMERSQRITEFLHEKRQIFVWQMILDGQRAEIARIDKHIAESEKSILEDEENIGSLSKKYKATQAQNESTVNRVRRKTDMAVQRRVELQTTLKRALGNVSATKSDIVKNQDILEEYRLFSSFLIEITPDNETTSEYFNVPQKLVGCLDALEKGNLLLIQAVQYYDDRMAQAMTSVEESSASDEAARKVDEKLKELADIVEYPDAINEKTFNSSKFIDSEYERLRKLIEDTYSKCLVHTGDIGPLGMLMRLENQLEEFYKRIDRVSPAFIALKQAQQTKRRRELQRQNKQLRQEAEQKIKMEQALYRATRPIQKRSGRPLILRTIPFKPDMSNDKAILAALREQSRIDDLLFGRFA
jgi:hypothetical protein